MLNPREVTHYELWIRSKASGDIICGVFGTTKEDLKQSLAVALESLSDGYDIHEDIGVSREPDSPLCITVAAEMLWPKESSWTTPLEDVAGLVVDRIKLTEKTYLKEA